jgi:predicted O-methyltransferase YrrM
VSGTTIGVDELDRLVGELGVEGWCRPAERHLLYHLARYGPGTGAIVEIGTWKGLSTLYLAAGSKAAGRERVTAIDLFPYSTMTALHTNLLHAGVHDWVTPLAADSREAAMAWQGPAIRLLFIDGDHTDDGVRQDYAAWQAHVAPGGLIAFHDALEPNWPDVSRFLDEVLPGDEWVAYAIADPAPPAMPAGADWVANTIVVAQRRGPGFTPLTIPGGHGPFTTIRHLLERLRGLRSGHDPEAVVRAQSGPAPPPTTGQATYDYTANLEAQFYAAEEYALELEERLDEIVQAYAELQAAYEQVAASARALDSTLRAANPIKNRLGHLRQLITRPRLP